MPYPCSTTRFMPLVSTADDSSANGSFGADYVPPPPEDLLGPGGEMDALTAGFGMGGATSLTPLERARLEWALDGNPSSPYPEDADALVPVLKGAAPPAAKAGAAASPGGAGGQQMYAEYLKAVADIRARAAARAEQAEQKK
jgi:hypothetical protein